MTEQRQTNQTELFAQDEELDQLLNHIETLESDPRIWPKTLADLIAVIESQLKHRYPALENHYELARTSVISIAHYLGGRQLYLPRDDRLQRAMRDYHIYHHQFTGNNHAELAAEHGLTTIQIYNIVAYQHKLHIARIQPALF